VLTTHANIAKKSPLHTRALVTLCRENLRRTTTALFTKENVKEWRILTSSFLGNETVNIVEQWFFAGSQRKICGSPGVLVFY